MHYWIFRRRLNLFGLSDRCAGITGRVRRWWRAIQPLGSLGQTDGLVWTFSSWIIYIPLLYLEALWIVVFKTGRATLIFSRVVLGAMFNGKKWWLVEKRTIYCNYSWWRTIVQVSFGCLWTPRTGALTRQLLCCHGNMPFPLTFPRCSSLTITASLFLLWNATILYWIYSAMGWALTNMENSKFKAVRYYCLNFPPLFLSVITGMYIFGKGATTTNYSNHQKFNWLELIYTDIHGWKIVFPRILKPFLYKELEESFMNICSKSTFHLWKLKYESCCWDNIMLS